MNSYLDLVTKQTKLKESAKEQNIENNLEHAIIHFAARLDPAANIYEALRNFIEEHTESLDKRAELLDTIEFCEADEADLESTIIKLKIVLENPVLSEVATIDNYSKNSMQEGSKMIDKDFLITESDVTSAVKTNKNDTPRKELDPVRCFVVLDKNDMPMLNKGGIVITNTPDAEQQIQHRADDLYRLIHNAKSVYMIEDEAYDQCVDIRDKKEYVKFVKANGRLIKPSSAAETIPTTDLDDDADDFLINVEEMFE